MKNKKNVVWIVIGCIVLLGIVVPCAVWFAPAPLSLFVPTSGITEVGYRTDPEHVRILTEQQRQEFTEILKKQKFNWMLGGCKCRGAYNVVVTYENGDKIVINEYKLYLYSAGEDQPKKQVDLHIVRMEDMLCFRQ